jgi:hypothetical protein
MINWPSRPYYYKDGLGQLGHIILQDAARAPINFEDVMDNLKGARISAIVQCAGVWIAGGKFGCSWKVLWLKITQPQTIPITACLAMAWSCSCV